PGARVVPAARSAASPTLARASPACPQTSSQYIQQQQQESRAMLFIKADRDAILKPLQTVAGIVERRHTLPILANVLLRKQGPAVSFLASDVEIQVQTTAELGAGPEEAATTVSAKKLIDILRAMPEGVEVAIKLADKRAT